MRCNPGRFRAAAASCRRGRPARRRAAASLPATSASNRGCTRDRSSPRRARTADAEIDRSEARCRQPVDIGNFATRPARPRPCGSTRRRIRQSRTSPVHGVVAAADHGSSHRCMSRRRFSKPRSGTSIRTRTGNARSSVRFCGGLRLDHVVEESEISEIVRRRERRFGLSHDQSPPKEDQDPSQVRPVSVDDRWIVRVAWGLENTHFTGSASASRNCETPRPVKT